MEGIEETKEVLNALNVLSIKVISLVKKHAGVPEMIVSVLGDEELKKAIQVAAEGIQKVPAELKDLSFVEGMDLAMFEASKVPAILDALKA